jgi:hypothetical protein
MHLWKHGHNELRGTPRRLPRGQEVREAMPLPEAARPRYVCFAAPVSASSDRLLDPEARVMVSQIGSVSRGKSDLLHTAVL